jgi:hypothetical protein
MVQIGAGFLSRSVGVLATNMERSTGAIAPEPAASVLAHQKRRDDNEQESNF